VMEKQQFKLTYRNNAREDRDDRHTNKLERVRDAGFEIDKIELMPEKDKIELSPEIDQIELTHDTQHSVNTSVSNENLETRISGESETINVTGQIGQKHATLARFTGSRGNNNSGDNMTKASSAHNTLSWKIDKLATINSGEKGVARGVRQLQHLNTDEPENSGETAVFWAPQASPLADVMIKVLTPASESVEASIAKAISPINEALQRNQLHATAAYAGIKTST